MARTISITSPSEKSDTILRELKGIKGLLELQLFRHASIEPPGDIIKVAIPNAYLNEVMQLLDAHHLGENNGVSLSSSEPASLIPTKSAYEIERDTNEASWEEMEMTISNDSNTSIKTLLIMCISGALATIGIATNELHIVIGGMLVAPGFMPFTRIALGLAGRHKAWHYGIYDVVKGYLTLIAGAAVTALLLKAVGYDPLGGASSYYVTKEELLNYWTTVTTSSLLASGAASIAGVLLVATRKSVFTSGVMIGLALVPTAAIMGISGIEGDFELAGRAFLRFALDAALVFIFSLLVFLWIRLYSHKRDIRL